MEKIKKFIIDSIHGRNISISDNMDKLKPIINICHPLFPNANINPNTNTLQLSGNINNQGNFIIDANRVFIEVQDPKNTKILYKLYMDVVNIMTDKFGIDSFNRIGIRHFIGREIEDENLINSLIIKKFMKPNVIEYGENLNNMHIGFSTTYNKYKINHNFARLATQNINMNSGKVQTKTNNFLLYDIDFYKDSPTNKKDINIMMDDASRKINTLSEEYFASIGGE